MGANYLDAEDVWHTYRTQHGLVNNYINDIFIGDDDGGTVWFGTGYYAATGGASYFDEYGFLSIASGDNALSDGYVTAISVFEGGWWLGVYGGGVDYFP